MMPRRLEAVEFEIYICGDLKKHPSKVSQKPTQLTVYKKAVSEATKQA